MSASCDRYDGLRHAARQSPTRTYVTPYEGGAEGALTRAAVYAPSVGGSVGRAYHLDAQGSVAAVTDANQATVTRYETDAWGNVSSGLVAEEPAIYGGGLGYWYDPDLALYYVKARWLDPTTGRWLSVDPVESEPRYTYVANQPTTKVDPTGEQFGAPRTDPGSEAMIWNYIMGRVWTQAGAEVAGGARQFQDLPDRIDQKFVEATAAAEEYAWRPLMEGGGERAGRLLRNTCPSLAAGLKGLWRAIGSEVPLNLWYLISPGPDDPTGTAWLGGFVWGGLQMAGTSLLGVITDVLRYALFSLMRLPEDERRSFWQYVSDAFEPILATYRAIPDMLPYDRGKACGVLVLSAIGLIRAGRTAFRGANVLRSRGALRAASELEGVAAEAVSRVPEGARAKPSAGVYDRAKTRFARLRTQLDRTLREQGTGRSPVPSQQQYDKAVGLLAKMKQRAQQLASLRRRLRAVRVGDLFVGPADDLRGLNRADRVPHHGVMSAWMRENYARYAAGTAPAVLLDTRDHYKTLGVFNKWRRRAEVPVADGGVAWARISERQARDLAEAQFDAANVPAAARREYWGQFATYKALLGPRIRR